MFPELIFIKYIIFVLFLFELVSRRINNDHILFFMLYTASKAYLDSGLYRTERHKYKNNVWKKLQCLTDRAV